MTFPFPKVIDRLLRKCHPGVGFIYYNAGSDTTMGAEFCIGRDNKMVYVQSGTPVTMELTDENHIVRRFKITLVEDK